MRVEMKTTLNQPILRKFLSQKHFSVQTHNIFSQNKHTLNSIRNMKLKEGSQSPHNLLFFFWK